MVDENRTKGPDEMFCTSCGNIISRRAAICVGCGTATGVNQAPFGSPPPQPHHYVNAIAVAPMAAVFPKSKGTAVVLAIFLGFWTWVYTYQKDAWKFWLNLVLTVLSFGFWGIVAWIWAVIDAAVRPSSWYDNFPLG